MSSGVTTGLFAIGGVIVGGGLNLVSGMVLDRRRERRNLRSAARLIHSELKLIEIVLGTVLSSGRWGELPEIDTGRWVEYERDLSVWLSNADWESLAVVYQSIALFATESAEAKLEATDDEPVDMSGEDLAHVRLTLETVRDALPRIRKLAGLAESDGDMTVYERYVEARGAPVEPISATRSRWWRWFSTR